MAHWSSCAVHNEPALPKGECDCGNDAPEVTLASQLLERWEVIDAERKRAVGPNPIAVHSISVAAGNFLDLIDESAIYQKNNFGQLD